MNSNVLAFSEPREASRSAANLRAFSEVNKVALGTEVELRVPGRIAFQQAAAAAAR